MISGLVPKEVLQQLYVVSTILTFRYHLASAAGFEFFPRIKKLVWPPFSYAPATKICFAFII